MTPTRRPPATATSPRPLRTFYFCPFCGMTILLRLWQGDLGCWVHLAAPGRPARTPVFGEVHHCGPREEHAP